jgi:hypothetical protein
MNNAQESQEEKKYTQLNVLQDYEFAKTAVIAGNVHSRELIALKPIAENLGLSWSAVQQKLKRDKNATQLSVYANVTSADGKQREMLCLDANQLQDWLWSINPIDSLNQELLEVYKKGLVIYLIKSLHMTLDELNKVKGIADEYVTLKNVVTQYINANEQGKELTKKAKEYFKQSNILQKKITERMNENNLDQLKIF